MSLFERLKNKRYALQEQETIKDPWFTDKDDNPDLENKNNTKKINFSNLLVEMTKRTLNENKFESNLFFL